MKMKTHDAIVYRYHEFLKELYIDTQYIAPINMGELVAKHEIAKRVPTVAKEIGIIRQVEINGRKLKGRYTWLVGEPTVDMAIQLKDSCRQHRKAEYNNPEGYWKTTSYLFGLFTTRKWIKL